jgi:hypothetical protein
MIPARLRSFETCYRLRRREWLSAAVRMAMLPVFTSGIHAFQIGIDAIAFSAGPDLEFKQGLGSLVIVLADVTSSLNAAEFGEVIRLTNEVVDALSPATEYRIYPIHMEMQRPALVHHGMVPTDAKLWGDPELVKLRNQMLAEKLRQQYRMVNARDVKVDKRSCLLDGLVFAADTFKQPAYRKVSKRLVIISDMIEDCSMTPLGRPISLAKRDIRAEIVAAAQFPSHVDLSKVDIEMIVPSNPLPALRTPPRPRLEDLESFWGRILERTAAKKERCRWSVGALPSKALASTYGYRP